jgi:phospholipase/lecithinase/hemolysin
LVPSVAATDLPPAADQNPPFSAVYVLGDSLSDTGRTASVIPNVFAFLYPSPPYAPGRLSNGPLWIEYFAPQVRLPYNPVDNFSWAGANTGTLNVFPGLPGMLNELTELVGSPARTLDRKALYVVCGGANDFFRFFTSPPADPAVVIPAGVTSLVTIVATLRAAGAEHIVVVDLPDVGRTPRGLSGGPAASAGATFLSVTFNTLLNNALDALPFPVVRVSLFNLLNEFAKNPYKYGFQNVTGQGKLDPANGDRYLFWDDIHPTTRGHRLIADEVFHVLASTGRLGLAGK